MTSVSHRNGTAVRTTPDAALVTSRTDAPANSTAVVTRGRVGGGHEGTGERAPWKSVALPAEHGGWGLSAEPGLLGLLVAPSWAGAAIAVAAVVAFLVRTPLKLAVIDRRRGRRLERTRLATRIAAVELTLLAGLAAVAVALAGPRWLVPIAVASPFILLELWFDVRSRGRRLIPELAGSVGICSVAAAVAVAGGAGTRLAVALWLILAARAVATVAFARVQVVRFRRELRRSPAADLNGGVVGFRVTNATAAPAVRPESGGSPEMLEDTSTRSSDWAQVAGLAIAVAALAVSPRVVAGTVFIAVVAIGELVAVRRSPIRPKILGFTQLGIGLGLVAVTATSVTVL